MENRPQSVTESTRLAHQTLIRRCGDEFNAREEDEEEVEELEEKVHEMALRLSNYRSTFPDQLRSGFASVLGAERPEFPFFDWDSDAAFARDMDKDQASRGESCEGVISAVEDQEAINGVSLIKEKISSNVSVMPLVLKRMNECIFRINKLRSRSDIIYSAFKREKNNIVCQNHS